MREELFQTGEVYKIFDVDVISEKEGSVLIHSRRSTHSRWLTLSELQLLFSCREFESLAVHATNYVRHMKLKQQRNQNRMVRQLSKFLTFSDREEKTIPDILPGEISPFLEQLQEFAAKEYLISESSLVNEMDQLARKVIHQRVSVTNRIGAIGIPTCNRPKTLERCLRSFFDNFNRHQRSPDILILDDSHSTRIQQQNRSVIITLQKGYSGRIRYMNRRHRRRFARFVAHHAGLGVETLEFALMGHPSCHRSEGGCRNTLLLLTLGQLVLQTDDDTICRPAKPLVSHTGLKLNSTLSSDDYWFFKSYQEVLETIHFIDTDFLALHEQYLGKDPQSIISTCLNNGIKPDISKLNASFIEKLKSGNAKIRMTLPGPAGDTCLFTDLYRLFLKGESYRRLITPLEDYLWHLSTRQVVRSVSSTVLSDMIRCIGMNFAIDNRSLLPPFMPVQARCDGIFGDLMSVAFPEAFAGNIPWILPHNPPDPRTRSVDELFSMLESVRVNDIVSILIFAMQDELKSKASSENLRTAGQLLIELGRKSDRQFRNEIHYLYTLVLKQTVQMGEQALDSKINAPEAWQDHVRRYMKVLERSIQGVDFLIPADINKPSSSDKQDFKEIVCLFGELLIYWPDIYESIQSITEDEMTAYVEPIRV